jgi:hypothetical protein
MNAMADAACLPVSLAQLLASRDARRATAALVNAVGTDAHFDDPGLAGRGQRHAGLQGCNGGGECGSFGAYSR